MTRLVSPEQAPRSLDDALRVDRVLTESQIARHFAAAEEVKQYPQRVVHVSATKRGPEIRVRFYAHDDATLRLDAAALRHLALAAELRLELGVPPEEWQSAADVASLDKPDAMWIGGNAASNGIPVEIDVGTYSRERILHKLLRYQQHYGSQVWGTTSSSRMSMIHDLADSADIINYRLILLRFP